MHGVQNNQSHGRQNIHLLAYNVFTNALYIFNVELFYFQFKALVHTTSVGLEPVGLLLIVLSVDNNTMTLPSAVSRQLETWSTVE